MRLSTLAAITALFFPAILFAQDANSYRCTFGDNVRRVEIVAEPGVTVPCEVHYYKDTEVPGERQVLWRALNEEGFCEARTQEFIVSLTEWGWNCSAGDPVMPAEEAADEMLGDPAMESEPDTENDTSE